MTHGKEGDGQAGAKEDDEVEGQLVPESGKSVSRKCNVKVQFGARDNSHRKLETLKEPVVDGEGEVVAWGWEAITTTP